MDRSGDDNAVVLKAFVVSICPHALMMPEHHEQHSNAVCNLQYTISATCSILYGVEMRLSKVCERLVSGCAEPGPLSTMCRGRICTDKVLQTVGCSEKVCFPHQRRSLAISIMSWQKIICNKFGQVRQKIRADTMCGVKPYLSPNTAISTIDELISVVYFHFSYKTKNILGKKKTSHFELYVLWKTNLPLPQLEEAHTPAKMDDLLSCSQASPT